MASFPTRSGGSIDNFGGLLSSASDSYALKPPPPAVLEYLPENASATGWLNTGTGGAAHHLSLVGATAAILLPAGGPNGHPALRFDPGVVMQSATNLPIFGQAPRTVYQILKLYGTSGADLCGWGEGSPGRAYDVRVNGGAGIIVQHIFDAAASLKTTQAGVFLALLSRGNQVTSPAVGWQVWQQSSETPTPEPVLTSPVVDTSSTPFRLNRGTIDTPSYRVDHCETRVWDYFLTNGQHDFIKAYTLEKYGLAF